jgi:regulator of sigma E protease
VWGYQYLPNKNVKYGIVVNETAKEMGLRNGDKIISVDNKIIEDFDKITPAILFDGIICIQVERDNQKMDIAVSKESISRLIKTQHIIGTRVPFSLIVEGPAQNEGLELGDRILALNGHKYEFNDQFTDSLTILKGQEVKIAVLRNGKEKVVPVKIGTNGLIGVVSHKEGFFDYKTVHYNLLQSIPAGIIRGYDAIGIYLKEFKMMFTPETKAYQSLGGFISIGNVFPEIWNWQTFWSLTAFLSIILAVMNILPIPALDGGHVIFLLYEIITRRKPGNKFMEYAQITGMVILFSLLLYANGNDITKIINS